MNNKIYKIIRRHTKTVNSFIDDDGYNHLMPCVQEITNELFYIEWMLETAQGYLEPESEAYKHLQIAQQSLLDLCKPDLSSSRIQNVKGAKNET